MEKMPSVISSTWPSKSGLASSLAIFFAAEAASLWAKVPSLRVLVVPAKMEAWFSRSQST